jgi:hypothetical protein
MRCRIEAKNEQDKSGVHWLLSPLVKNLLRSRVRHVCLHGVLTVLRLTVIVGSFHAIHRFRDRQAAATAYTQNNALRQRKAILVLVMPHNTDCKTYAPRLLPERLVRR